MSPELWRRRVRPGSRRQRAACLLPCGKPITRRLSLLLLLTLLAAAPSLAKVLAEGKPKGGFYWQKIEQKSGKVVYQCRATEDSKFQKAAACEKAGAVKPK